jgi:hypothetical protein
LPRPQTYTLLPPSSRNPHTTTPLRPGKGPYRRRRGGLTFSLLAKRQAFQFESFNSGLTCVTLTFLFNSDVYISSGSFELGPCLKAAVVLCTQPFLLPEKGTLRQIGRSVLQKKQLELFMLESNKCWIFLTMKLLIDLAGPLSTAYGLEGKQIFATRYSSQTPSLLQSSCQSRTAIQTTSLIMCSASSSASF